MAGNKDLINILQEIRGTGIPGEQFNSGIWYELTIADKNGNPGVYGDILAKYGVIAENSPTLEQAIEILENLNVEVTTLPAGSQATSALINGVWQIGIPEGLAGSDGEDGKTPVINVAYDTNGNLVYTVTVDGVEIANTTLLNLDQLVNTTVNDNVDVQTTLQAKQEVELAVAEAQAISDGLDADVISKKAELDTYTNVKTQELNSVSDAEQLEISTHSDSKKAEFDTNALNRISQYDSNHNTKFSQYNDNNTLKLAQYNANHVNRLDELNYAYADRITDLLETKRLLGVVDQFNAVKPTQYAEFLDVSLPDYIYYLNGIRIYENTDYTVYNGTSIEIPAGLAAHDVVLQINAKILGDLLIFEGQVTQDMIGVPDGVAGLDSNGQVPSTQLPSYVDDVLEFATYSDLPAVGESGKIYVVVADETQGGNTTSYRWASSTYALISNNLTAEDIKTLYESNTNTNVFTDSDKLEVDTIQSRLDTKQDTLVDSVNIKTINGDGITGAGNLLVSAGASGFAANVYLTDQVSTTVGTYKQLSYTPDELSTEIIAQVDNVEPVLVQEYIFDGDVVADFIPAGEWQFSFSRKVDNNAGETKLKFELFKRSSLGIETILFSKYSNEINDVIYTNENIIFIESPYVVEPTDRIGLRVYAETTRNSLTTVNIQIGDGNAAYLISPLGLRHNQLRARDEENAHPISSITGLSSSLDTLQQNLDNLSLEVGDLDYAVGTINSTKRYDKILNSLDIIDMVYNNGNLVIVRYLGDNNSNIYYRSVMTYTDGNLTRVDYFYSTPDLITESARTILTYDVLNNLITTEYTE